MPTEVLFAGGVVAAMLASAALGWQLRRRLDDRHLSAQSVDSIRLLMGMLLTFAALVLGLLTSNAKQRFDGLSDGLSTFAADLIELDRGLALYGPEADGTRRLLRQYTAAAIHDTWPAEPAPAGSYPLLPHAPASAGIEDTRLGAMLGQVSAAVLSLAPANDVQRLAADALRVRAAATVDQRWHLILAARSTVAWPFLLILTTWLCIVFAIFGMTSPPGRVVYAAVALSALSIASPLYLIIDYSDALSGSIALSSGPLRAALAHMDAPPAP